MSKAKSFEQGLEEFNRERIAQAIVDHRGSMIFIKNKDLREILFRMRDDYKIVITPSILYRLLVNEGIWVKGFKPNKTALRNWGMSPKDINSLLPGSFPSEEK